MAETKKNTIQSPDLYIGHPLQLYGVEEYKLMGGKGDGMHLLRVRNGKGIDMTICADRCADISELYFDGMRMNYTSPCGYVSPQYYTEGRDGFGFLKSFNCGMLTTCGLQNIGVPNEENGTFYGLHGTIGNTPADHIYYETDDSSITIHADILDNIIFGQKLTLRRTITVSRIANTIELCDEVINKGSKPEPVMLLYHMNVGYPLLSEKTKLDINSTLVEPRDDRAAEDLNTWNKMLKPTPDFVEQCYYHTFKDKKAQVSVTNETIKKGLELSFNTQTFPQMTEWKMMGEHDYVLGIEPCTNTLEGHTAVEESGKLNILQPGKKKKYKVTLNLIRL